MSESPQRYLVTVCQHRSCLRNGAAAVLARLQEYQSETLRVSGCECQGQCGSGPTVRVTPGNTWYCQVTPAAIDRIVASQLQGDGQPVAEFLNPRLHPPPSAYANLAAQYQAFLEQDSTRS